ncbi:hypothetical protein [Candidatus Palauibacter sp.]|uniref:hypothetical protein n=1 Tax=Candidatus Palauibacter sp. TaxID=3101350 RepID=UPI003B515C9E
MSNRYGGNFEIYAMNADGTGVTRLTTTSAEGDAADDLLSGTRTTCLDVTARVSWAAWSVGKSRSRCGGNAGAMR